jgi:hypothetical protein
VLVTLALTTPFALGQSTSGSLLGDVRADGKAIAGVHITARETRTGFERLADTDAAGAYRIDNLLPGDYRVTAAQAGFRTLAIDNIIVAVDQRTRFDVDLVAGSDRETVTVTSKMILLNTDRAPEGVLLDSTVTRNLPLSDRNLMSLVTLAPGAIPRQLGGFAHDIMNDLQPARGSVGLNAPVNGARSTGNSYVLDGALNTDRNTFAIAVNPPVEAVEEFQVQTSLAPAEFASRGGAVVNTATKSGSGSWHGNAFEYFRNQATDAKSYFAVPELAAGIFRQNQFGATLGGPLALRQKRPHSTFFFAAYEGNRKASSSPSQHLVPDAQLRSGNFSGNAVAGEPVIFDPLTSDSQGNRIPFTGNLIPQGRLSRTVQRYLSQYQPLPNNPTNPFSNLIDATPSAQNNDSGSFRVDHAMGAHRLFARYTMNEDRGLLAGNFPQRPVSESLRAQQISLGHTLAGARWVNENHISYTRLRVNDVPLSGFGSNVLRDLGIQGFADDPANYGLPAFVVTNFEMVQDSGILPQLQNDNLWHAASSFSRTQGTHTWKVGAQFSRFAMNYRQSQFARGQYQFNGTYTAASDGSGGDPFADFLLGYASATQRQVGSLDAGLRQNSFAAFVQDDWRVHSRITLLTGLRYEYNAPYHDVHSAFLNVDYSRLPAAPELRAVQSSSASDGRVLAPRAGIAIRLPHLFSKTRETVFRAGYGLYFSPEIAMEAYSLVRNGVKTEINQPNSSTPSLTVENGFPVDATFGLPSYTGVDPTARTPYSQQWSAGFQRELPGAIALDVSYVGSKGTRLGRFRRFNTPAHTELGLNLAPRPGDLQSLRTFPDLGPLFQIQHNANSTYHSLQIRGEKRLSKGLAFLSSFVWSKSIDDADSIVPGLFESFGAQNEGNLKAERGRSFFDVTRRFVADITYAPPSAPVLKPVLRNWQFSAITTFQDGTPLNPVYFATDFANSGTPNRPNIVAGQPILLPAEQRDANHLYNPAAFSDPAPYTYGNAGRNILPGLGNAVVDVGVHRRFALKEGWTITARAESFNLLNHPNLGIPGPYPDFGPFFGKAFSSGEPRRFQFALRFDF